VGTTTASTASSRALRRDPALLAKYNALKRGFDGLSMDDYRSAKRAFIERVLAAQRVGTTS
jgi:GrpB-like predicted nucleotidyltransferase (UPF0157 family)